MATVANVTVNGQAVEKYLGQQKSVEIQKFLADEMRGFRFARQRHFTSHSTKNVSKPVDAGNGSIRFK